MAPSLIQEHNNEQQRNGSKPLDGRSTPLPAVSSYWTPRAYNPLSTS
jgi:hypothetical protein